jgi:hypothetical protein
VEEVQQEKEPTVPRKTSGLHDQNSLRTITDQLQKMAASLGGLVQEMDKHGVDQLQIACHSEAMRGLRGLESFVFSGSKAMRQALEERGAFQAQRQPVVTAKEKASRK